MAVAACFQWHEEDDKLQDDELFGEEMLHPKPRFAATAKLGRIPPV